MNYNGKTTIQPVEELELRSLLRNSILLLIGLSLLPVQAVHSFCPPHSFMRSPPPHSSSLVVSWRSQLHCHFDCTRYRMCVFQAPVSDFRTWNHSDGIVGLGYTQSYSSFLSLLPSKEATVPHIIALDLNDPSEQSSLHIGGYENGVAVLWSETQVRYNETNTSEHTKHHKNTQPPTYQYTELI